MDQGGNTCIQKWDKDWETVGNIPNDMKFIIALKESESNQCFRSNYQVIEIQGPEKMF